MLNRLTKINAIVCLIIVLGKSLQVNAQRDFIFASDTTILTAEGTFLLEMGWISKGVFHQADARSLTSQGFFKLESKDDFILDTLFEVMERGDRLGRMLDSIGINYLEVHSKVEFLDSIRSKYSFRQLKRYRIKKGSGTASHVVFLPLKLKIIYCNSYVGTPGYFEPYRITKCKYITSIQGRLFVKPILKIIFIE